MPAVIRFLIINIYVIHKDMKRVDKHAPTNETITTILFNGRHKIYNYIIESLAIITRDPTPVL